MSAKQNMEKLDRSGNRKYLGRIDVPLDHSSPETLAVSKQERHFFQRMLRAYLRGATYFKFGFETIAGRRYPKEWKVMQEVGV